MVRESKVREFSTWEVGRGSLLQHILHRGFGLCAGLVEVDSLRLIPGVLYQVSGLHKHVIHLVYLHGTGTITITSGELLTVSGVGEDIWRACRYYIRLTSGQEGLVHHGRKK